MVVHNVNSSVEICLLTTDFMVKISYLVLNIFSCLVPVHHPKSMWLRPCMQRWYVAPAFFRLNGIVT